MSDLRKIISFGRFSGRSVTDWGLSWSVGYSSGADWKSSCDRSMNWSDKRMSEKAVGLGTTDHREKRGDDSLVRSWVE